MTTAEAALWETVESFYSAATRPAEWDEALARLARLCGAEVAGIHIDAHSHAAHCSTSRWHGLEPSFNAAYVNHYWREDPWWATLAGERMVGTVGMGEELVPRRTLERSAFHNELSLRYGLDDLVGGLLTRTDDERIVMGIMGGRGMRFDETHRRIVTRVLPHLTRAVTIGKRLLCVVSDDLRPLLEERLRGRFPLTRTEARVATHIGHGLSPKETALALGSSWNTVRAHLRRVFAKTHTGRQADLVRLVHSLEPGTRIEPATTSTEEYLRQRYRLTTAETRVAMHIGRGLSAKEAAEHLGSTWNTVRSHLREIYAKTRVSGHVELTRLVTTLDS